RPIPPRRPPRPIRSLWRRCTTVPRGYGTGSTCREVEAAGGRWPRRCRGERGGGAGGGSFDGRGTGSAGTSRISTRACRKRAQAAHCVCAAAGLLCAGAGGRIRVRSV
ncbi:hypothetical protein HK405_011737, partial [Cladochytrium tenue]